MHRLLGSVGAIALLASLPFSAVPTVAQTPDLSGEWTLSWETPRGDRTMDVALEQSEMTFTGTASTQMGDAPISEGSIEGDRVTFTLSMAMGGRGGGGGGQGRTIEQRFEGVLADGEITGDLTMSGMGGRGGGGGGGGERSFAFTMRRVEG
ncbi:MAG: hypothetical protein KJO11_07440 [Gemmatimonadetes bacterium]|nr:hypothetical protein [Gemmatimonadota bacterium]MBT8403544.1 hypothetical protein [Gemmatimonadota bacterium]